MPISPGEPLEKITLNIFRRDMDLLRQRYPRGGHLTFIKRLVRAWADQERLGENWREVARAADVEYDELDPDESLETLKTLERKFP